MTLSALRRISLIPMKMRSVTAANIMMLNPALYTLEQDTMIRVLVGSFQGIALLAKMKIR